ncbi:MAG: RidA family protein [SAR202 cluster bacterium]|jgi:enamine deaminase RidA (YjgF/YER057c/UK114 family)|nr:RidA family protein [SAR202 cluster bacterium]|tara:strand:+ start:100 stop:489 length:390 start_codon:yes stop_codon:yes gene_type:complete
MTIERKNYPGIPVTGSPHFHSVRTGNFLFLAGATAKMTSAENGTMADQTKVILERMRYILECEGGSLCDVVKMTSYVTDLSESAKSQTQDIRREYFGESLPASTRVQVAGLDGPSLLIEIDAIAMIPEN